MSWITIGGGSGGEPYPVLGAGLLAGTSAGAIGRTLAGTGAVRVASGNGIAAAPSVVSLAVPVVIARARINLATTAAQAIPLIPGMDRFEVVGVSLGSFIGEGSEAQGGFYAAPPVSGFNVAAAVIVPGNTPLPAPGRAAGLLKLPVDASLWSVSQLWFCPTVAASSGLSCEVEIVAVARWSQGLDPDIGLPTGVTVTAMGDSYTARTSTGYITNLSAEMGWTLNNRGSSGTVQQNSIDADGAAKSGNAIDNLVTRALTGTLAQFYVDAYGGFNDLRYTAAPATFNVAGFIRDKRKMWNAMREAGIPLESIVCFSPWWPSDATLVTGSTGFTGQTRAGALEYVDAMFMLAAEYGFLFFDMYNWLRLNGGVANFSGDAIHMNNEVGNPNIIAGVKLAKRLNRLARPTAIAAVAGAGTIAVSATAPAAPVTNYDIEWGGAGSWTYPNRVTTTLPATVLEGLPTGSYRVRMRANHVVGGPSPWEFCTTIAVVA